MEVTQECLVDYQSKRVGEPGPAIANVLVGVCGTSVLLLRAAAADRGLTSDGVEQVRRTLLTDVVHWPC